MIIQLFNHTLEIHFYKSGYNRHFAKKLLNRYWLSPANGHKIGLIKLLREQSNNSIGLKDAKDAIEAMFDFPDNRPVIR